MFDYGSSPARFAAMGNYSAAAMIDHLEKSIDRVARDAAKLPPPTRRELQAMRKMRETNPQLGLMDENIRLRAAVQRATATIGRMTTLIERMTKRGNPFMRGRAAPTPIKADPVSGYIPRYTR
jgi:hypothetical protein